MVQLLDVPLVDLLSVQKAVVGEVEQGATELYLELGRGERVDEKVAVWMGLVVEDHWQLVFLVYDDGALEERICERDRCSLDFERLDVDLVSMLNTSGDPILGI